MKITRSRPQRDFVVIPNAALEDDRLSWKARGLLAYLLSRPASWSTDSRTLAQVGPDGREGILTGLKELEVARYLVRTRTRGARGRWATRVEVFDFPQPEPVEDVPPGSGFPAPVGPAPVGPAPAAPAPAAPDPGRPDAQPQDVPQDVGGGGEDPSSLPTTRAAATPSGPAAADRRAVQAVAQDDVDRVVGHLPAQLQPRTPAEGRRLELYVRQRVAVGRSADWLIEAARTCELQPKGSPLGLWTAHVDRAWHEQQQEAAKEPSRSRPEWCGDCDPVTRCPLDEYGYPDTTQKCHRCHPQSFGAFVGAS